MGMTREEVISTLEVWIERDNAMEYADRAENIEIYKMAIKALEQQPSDDCVSRKAVNMLSIDLVYVTGDKADFLCKFWTGLDALPSVTPKAKTGHWIMKHRSYSEMKYLTGTDEMGIEHTVKKYESYEIDEPYCSECGKLAGDTSQNYCCACGVKMESEE